ncbi:MAG: family 10 glycosylhydrolase [Gemmatimonadetes bacterium]|nr:family 10 glycosylhydrolase [Gemmatimonadota bacterium]
MARALALGATLLGAVACGGGGDPTITGPAPSPPPPTPVAFTVPPITREFRGVWIATVGNIDWPTRSGLTAGQQQAEIAALLDAVQAAGANAVLLQVRSVGDALYRSALEPWARVLTGTPGGDPGYDPLEYISEMTRARGLELHAWFNPFRAGNLSDSLTFAPTHFARRRPDLLRRACTSWWFDPAEEAVQRQALDVVTDVARRYAIDAVHLDDFFYPYPDTRCPTFDFPDSAGYAAYRAGGGTLVRNDWRRDNINRFVERLQATVRGVSPVMRVGISPFGIWRPGNPPGVTGLDAFTSIYADSRLWLQRGWVDYLAPQLYWSLASTGQPFAGLLGWWAEQNTLKRHLWPGMAAYRVADGTSSAYAASEIANQIMATRSTALAGAGVTGGLLYNATAVRTDRAGLTTLLGGGVYATPAIPPATPWLDAAAPPAPTVAVTNTGTALSVAITPAAGEAAVRWLVRWRDGTTWRQRVYPATLRTVAVTAPTGAAAVDGVVVNALDATWNASADAVWRPGS